MPEKGKAPARIDIECPKCGTGNSLKENVCTHCHADLARVKEIAVARSCREQTVRDPDGSVRPMVMNDLKTWAKEARKTRVCLVCGRSFDRLGTLYTFPCSFCEGLICRECVEDRNFEIKEPLLDHLKRFGLTFFQGMRQFDYYNTMWEIPPGYYLCKNCVYFLNGPEFIKHLKSYYEETGRLEELAELSEYQGQLEDAKHIRQAARAHPHPNLNSLIDKLREEGLAVPYRCPSCGANITVDSRANAEGLKFCSYCGTAVNMDALVRVLEASLKY